MPFHLRASFCFNKYINVDIFLMELISRHINESLQNSPYLEYLNLYSPREIFDMYKAGDKPWVNLINPESYHKALSEFMQYGELVRFPKDQIFKWFGIIMKNTAILRSLTEISGHDTTFPIDDFLDAFFYDYDNGKIDYDAWSHYKEEIEESDDFLAAYEYLDSLEPSFYRYFDMPDGTEPYSDYGVEPLEEIISEYNDDLSAEQTLVLLNKALDVTHQRGDLASIFIQGGAESLTRISEEFSVNRHINILNEIRNSSSFHIIKKDKRTGEFVSKKRFNSHDYIMKSLYDSEEKIKQNDKDIFHKLQTINESFLDDIDINDIDMGDEEEESGILVRNVSGGNTEIMFSDDRITDAFFCAVSNMIILDSSFPQYAKMDEIVKKSGAEKSRKMYVKEIKFTGSSVKFIIGDKATLGALYLTYKDEECTQVDIIFAPSSRAVSTGKFSYKTTYISLSYNDFCILSEYSRFIRKKSVSYYRSLLPELVKKFNSNGITITLAQRAAKIYSEDFRKTQDNSYLTKFKGIAKYSPDTVQNFSALYDAMATETETVDKVYKGIEPEDDINGSDYYNDEKYVLVARGESFIKAFFESPFSKLLNITKDDFIYMSWIKILGTQKQATVALAIPLSLFMILSPVFFMFLSSGKK